MKIKDKSYKWQHLTKDNNRGYIIANLIEPFILDHPDLRQQDYFYMLDMACGFAPVYIYFADYIKQYTGFDSHKPCINWLKRHFPEGDWQHVKDEDFVYPHKELDVLMLLGAGNAEREWESKREVETFEKLVKEFKPKVVILENTDEMDQTNWNYLVNTLSKEYVCELKASFKTDLDHCSLRKLRVHTLKNDR